MRGIYLQLKQCYSAHDYFTIKIDDSAFLVSTFHNFFFDFGFKFHSFSFSKIKILFLKYHSSIIDVLKTALRAITSGPSGRADRPLAALSAHGRHHGCRRTHCRALAHLPSGWCCGGLIRAPAVTAGAGQRARAASAAGRVWAAK
jgi:hypothetical protein